MLLLLWGDTEVEFVVHLQYHLGAHPFGLQSLLYAYHGPLDDIGRAALYGSIDGIALGISPHHSIIAVDVGQITSALAECLGVSLLTRHLYAVRHVLAHPGVGGKVSVDELLGLGAGHSHSFCQSKGTDAIDDSKIGCLGLASLIGGHILDILVEDFGRCGCMYIVAMGEGLYEVGVLTQMSHDAQFYLAVVGTEEEFSLIGDKGFAYLFAQGITYGDILQIGVAA